jgi:hypothetical protein
MFRCNYHSQGAHYLSMLKSHLLKQSIRIVNTLLWLIWWCGCIYEYYQVLARICLLYCSEPDQSGSEQCSSHTIARTLQYMQPHHQINHNRVF